MLVNCVSTSIVFTLDEALAHCACVEDENDTISEDHTHVKRCDRVYMKHEVIPHEIEMHLAKQQKLTMDELREGTRNIID